MGLQLSATTTGVKFSPSKAEVDPQYTLSLKRNLQSTLSFKAVADLQQCFLTEGRPLIAIQH